MNVRNYLNEVSFCWVYREANKALHILAKWSLKRAVFECFDLGHCPQVLLMSYWRSPSKKMSYRTIEGSICLVVFCLFYLIVFYFCWCFNKSFVLIPPKKKKKKWASYVTTYEWSRKKRGCKLTHLVGIMILSFRNVSITWFKLNQIQEIKFSL